MFPSYQEGEPGKSVPHHYYGDTVRALMMFGGIVMLGTLPFFADFIPYLAVISILAILALAIFGGFLNPRQRWLIVLDLVIVALAFLVFEFYSVSAFRALGVRSPFFLVNQGLALIFFVATYYAAKTVRGRFLTGELRRGQADSADTS